MLLDLEHAGVVNLTGPPDEITATMATMALELAASPLADSIEILCVGFGNQLAGLERVTVTDDIIDAARRIAAHDADAAELAAAAGMTALQGRVQGIGGDAWAPLVVFAPNPSHSTALAAAASSTPAAGVTAVVTGYDDAAWQMRLVAEKIQIPHLNLTLRRRNLTAVELATICDLVEDARNPAVSEGPDLVAVITGRAATVGNEVDPRQAEEPDIVDQPTPTPDKPPWDVDYVVEILGGLRVTRVEGEVVRFERSACPDLLAYLTQHRSGVTIDTTMEALWPNAEPNQRRANNIGSIARSTLGIDPRGNAYLPKVGIDGLYRLSERVGCDYDRFIDLVDYATNLQPADAVEILREGLSLVRGAPFDGIGKSDWAHLTGLYTEAVLAIDEAARTMATLALDVLDRPDDASWATTRGLQANPTSSELYLLRLRAAISRSDGLEADAVYVQYQTVMETDDDSHLDERMIELYESYRHSNLGRTVLNGPQSHNREPAQDSTLSW